MFQITENGTSENTTTGSRSNTQQPDEASSSLVIQNILINTEHICISLIPSSLEILLVSPEISLTSVVKCFGIVVVE
jgi:hypothetical protein